MRILFGIFVFGVLSSTAMAELVCPDWRIGGCKLILNAKTEAEYCPDCINISDDKKILSEEPKLVVGDGVGICKWGYVTCTINSRKRYSTMLIDESSIGVRIINECEVCKPKKRT